MESKTRAVSLEVWKQKEAERIKQLQRKEMDIFIKKIRTQWNAQQASVSKEWEQKESMIYDGFSKIESLINDFKAATSEQKSLEKQLKDLEVEYEKIQKIKVDNTRNERLSNIHSLRLEIQKLEEELTKSDAELRAAIESKNRYKRLFLESNKVLREIIEQQKKEKKERSENQK